MTSCREATEVTVEITTDINCADRPKTGVSLGPPSQIESRPLATATEQCDASTGRIGSIVLIPDKNKGEEFGLRVVAGMTMSAEECIQRGYVGGCVVSRRVLSFVPHDHLRLPIRLEASCIDVPCNATQTCRGGSCVSAVIADPSTCSSGSGCDVTPSLPGGGARGATTVRATTSSVGGAPLAGGTNNYLAGGAPTQTNVTSGGTLATEGTRATGGCIRRGGHTLRGSVASPKVTNPEQRVDGAPSIEPSSRFSLFCQVLSASLHYHSELSLHHGAPPLLRAVWAWSEREPPTLLMEHNRESHLKSVILSCSWPLCDGDPGYVRF